MSNGGSAAALRSSSTGQFQSGNSRSSCQTCAIHWIKVRVLHPDTQIGVGGIACNATLTNRTEAATLSRSGRRWGSMPAGNCSFSFPDFHGIGNVPATTL